jgi:hypothetical protein
MSEVTIASPNNVVIQGKNSQPLSKKQPWYQCIFNFFSCFSCCWPWSKKATVQKASDHSKTVDLYRRHLQKQPLALYRTYKNEGVNGLKRKLDASFETVGSDFRHSLDILPSGERRSALLQIANQYVGEKFPAFLALLSKKDQAVVLKACGKQYVERSISKSIKQNFSADQLKDGPFLANLSMYPNADITEEQLPSCMHADWRGFGMTDAHRRFKADLSALSQSIQSICDTYFTKEEAQEFVDSFGSGQDNQTAADAVAFQTALAISDRQTAYSDKLKRGQAQEDFSVQAMSVGARQALFRCAAEAYIGLANSPHLEKSFEYGLALLGFQDPTSIGEYVRSVDAKLQAMPDLDYNTLSAAHFLANGFDAPFDDYVQKIHEYATEHQEDYANLIAERAQQIERRDEARNANRNYEENEFPIATLKGFSQRLKELAGIAD